MRRIFYKNTILKTSSRGNTVSVVIQVCLSRNNIGLLRKLAMTFFLIVIWSNAVFCSDNEQTITILHNAPKDPYTANLIIFSYKRPMQLYALLESLEKYVTGLHHAVVLYRADDEDYECSYNIVKADFNDVLFVRQSLINPQADFKPLLLALLDASSSDFIMFATDDDIVKDYISLTQCTSALQQTNAYGFHLRLGKNTNYCYMWNRYQCIPHLINIGSSIYAWQTNISNFLAELDWAYPNSVDMTLYSKEKIIDALQTISYTNPSTLEARWFDYAHSEPPKIGLCFEQSKIVNIPANKVQDTLATNRSMNDETEHLHTLFKEGLKIDIQPFHQWQTNDAHVECTFNFIARYNKI